MKTCALLLAVMVAAAAVGGAQALRRRSSWNPFRHYAIEAKCEAAHDVDERVNATDCVALLGRWGVSGADVRILAEAAAIIGSSRAYAAVLRIERTLEEQGDDVEPRVRSALEECSRQYAAADAAFRKARQAIVESQYNDVADSLAGVPERGRRCDSEYAAAGSATPSPVSAFNGPNQQLKYITVAFTKLIK